MEQATTGNAPPPIAINSGGGILLNMRGAATLGATVVPSPGGSAQTATVVGSPGPQGKGGGVGPRMIISPQMLANRPGQPVEESDTKSVVYQCDDDKHELKTIADDDEPRCSPPASNTGVSSDLLQHQHACDDDPSVKCGGKGSELQKGDIILKNDKSNNILKASSVNNYVVDEGSNRSTDDDNDLSLNNSPRTVDKTVNDSGSTNQVVNERSVSPSDDNPKSPPPVPPPIHSPNHSHTSPSPPPSPNLPHNSDGDCNSLNRSESDPQNCDENKKNHDSGVVLSYDSDNNVSSLKSSSSTSRRDDADNLEIDQIEKSISMNAIANNSKKEKVSVVVNNGARKEINNTSNRQLDEKKCTYDVPEQDPVVRENVRPADNLSSNLGALHGNINDNNDIVKSNQLCVQNRNQTIDLENCEKSLVPEDEEQRCDTDNNNEKREHQEECVTVRSDFVDNNINNDSCSTVLNKCLTTNTTPTTKKSSVDREGSPPPLIQEQEPTVMSMGNNENKEATSVEDDLIVDDVNLDMFSDPEAHVHVNNSGGGPLNSSNGAIHVERSSSRSPCVGERNVETRGSTRENGGIEDKKREENRPKLMDMNLADFIFMDCEDEIESLQETAVSTTAAATAENQTWTQIGTLTPPQSAEHPYSPPKIINEIYSSNSQPIRTGTITAGTVSAVSHNSQPSSLPFWNKSKVGSIPVSSSSLETQQQRQQSPPSCAFQIYGVGQSHSNNNTPVAARIPLRTDHHNILQQQNSHSQYYTSPSSSPVRPSQPATYNTSNSNSYPSPIRANNNINVNINNVSACISQNSVDVTSEYKTNYGQQQQQQQQTCFTNDPQLYSQFIQYTKTYPLARGDKQEPPKTSPSTPSSPAILSTTVTRGHYVHTTTTAVGSQHQESHSKAHLVKPSIIPHPQQQQHQHSHHSINSIRIPTGAQSHIVPLQRQQYSPLVPQQYPQHQQNIHHHHQQQNSPFQSQYPSSSNVISANGCDNSSKSISNNPNMQQQVNFQGRPNYVVGLGQSPTSQTIRQSMGPVGGATGTFYPPSSVAQSQQMQIRQHHQPPLQQNLVQKELPSCSYANISGAGGVETRLYNPSHVNQPNFASANAGAGSHNNSAYLNNVAYNSSASGATRMPHPQSQHNSYPHSVIRPTANLPASQSNVHNYKPAGPRPTAPGGSGWNPPALSTRAQLLQVLRPNQNLGVRGTLQLQTFNRMPYPTPSQSEHPTHQQHFRSPQGQQHILVQTGMTQQHEAQQRTTSVIAPIANQQKHATSPSSPLMLRNPQFVAHFRTPTSSITSSGEHGHSSTSISAAYNQSVIRPNVYNPAGNTATPIMNSNAITNTSNSRSFYGNSSNINNNYYNNQASVIRPPQNSSSNNNSIISGSSISSTGNACTINRNTSSNCIVIERGGTISNAGQPHHTSSSSSSTGYPGDLTLQSFLSNPSAPFMCPSSSPSPTPTTANPSPLVERSTTTSSGGSGYYNHNENWGERAYHAHTQRGEHGTDQDCYTLSSCQYTDAMRRYNAPITLQALSGLPPGANHLLVKTENGQFQLVSVRMQSPTAAAAAPGTPVVPSTAAPPTSMSIAQQLPSNSPLAHPPPPLPPPHSAPSLVPPISSSMITTTTIPPHPSQQGRIISSSSSNHIVTSWSSSNSNSLVNNNSTTSSPLPIISSSAAPPPPQHPPHLAPPLPPSAPHPHSHPASHPHPPPPPPSVPSSVIMPPPVSASNSQLLSTANNISSSTSSSTNSSTNAAQAAISAVIDAYQSRAAAASASSAASSPSPQQQHPAMGPPGGNQHRQPPPPPVVASSHPLHNSVAPAAGPMNSIPHPHGASVIRGGVLGASSLHPPLPPVVVSTSSIAMANSVISSPVVTSTPNSNLPSSAGPTSPATFRPQSNTASTVPNNNATNNAQSGMGMMMTSSNSMSVHPNHHSHHQIHPQYSPLHPPPLPPQQAPPSAYHTSNSIASSNTTTANTVSQMSNETAKTKCKNFLSFLLELSAKQNQTVARNVKNLIQGLIDGKVNEENFADRLQKEVNSQPQPCLVGFLKKSLPHLRHSLAICELKIEGIKPPPLSTFVPPAPPVTALMLPTTPTPPEPTRKKPSKTPTVRPTTPTVPPSPVRIITPPVNSASPSTTPPTPVSASGTPAPPTTSPSPSSTKASKPSKGGSSKSKSNSSSNSSLAEGKSASSGPGGTPSSKSSIPSASKSSKEKEKKDKTFSSSGYSADDDINDVAAMGGVNLAEESQRILGSTEYVGTQIRSCRDETLIQASPIIAKFKVIAARYGLDEAPSVDVSALLSHAVEERLKTMIEKLSVIAEHRMDVIKLDERYEITQDVKGQLRFLEELDKLEKKRHDEQEREMLIRAAKSRSKSEDPEQAKLKAKAKEMQRVALEEMRQRDANLTALQAIGPRKKPKLDIGGSHGSAVPSPLGASGASSSLGRAQMPLRPRLKRVNLRDLLFLLEHDKETMRSPFLYKNLLLK